MTVATKTEWLEKLPSNCPPELSMEPDSFICFRLVESDPPSSKDFYSHRKLFPKKEFNANECRARSVSVSTDVDTVKNIKKLPTHRKKLVAKLTLKSKSGQIKQTGKVKSHYSWWLKSNYLSHIHCEIAS